jgi:hypothetical protein
MPESRRQRPVRKPDTGAKASEFGVDDESLDLDTGEFTGAGFTPQQEQEESTEIQSDQYRIPSMSKAAAANAMRANEKRLNEEQEARLMSDLEEASAKPKGGKQDTFKGAGNYTYARTADGDWFFTGPDGKTGVAKKGSKAWESITSESEGKGSLYGKTSDTGAERAPAGDAGGTPGGTSEETSQDYGLEPGESAEETPEETLERIENPQMSEDDSAQRNDEITATLGVFNADRSRMAVARGHRGSDIRRQALTKALVAADPMTPNVVNMAGDLSILMKDAQVPPGMAPAEYLRHVTNAYNVAMETDPEFRGVARYKGAIQIEDPHDAGRKKSAYNRALQNELRMAEMSEGSAESSMPEQEEFAGPGESLI